MKKLIPTDKPEKHGVRCGANAVYWYFCGNKRPLHKTSIRDPIVEAVKSKLDARSKLGIKKYVTTLADNNKSDVDPTYWLRMLQEELLDGANYCESEIQRILAKYSKKKKAL